MAVSTNGGAFTATRLGMTFNEDGSFMVVLRYKNAAAKDVVSRVINVPAGGGAITDQFGVQVAASTPGALTTALNAFITQIDAMLTSGAAGGKLDL
jgi:hypothetical protein